MELLCLEHRPTLASLAAKFTIQMTTISHSSNLVTASIVSMPACDASSRKHWTTLCHPFHLSRWCQCLCGVALAANLQPQSLLEFLPTSPASTNTPVSNSSGARRRPSSFPILGKKQFVEYGNARISSRSSLSAARERLHSSQSGRLIYK